MWDIYSGNVYVQSKLPCKKTFSFPFKNLLTHSYVIIPACNSHSHLAELDHIDTWAGPAGHNNLHLNRVKCVELIVSAPRCRRQFDPPPCIPDIKRLDWIGLCSVLRPRQHSNTLYGRRFLQVKRPNQQYQSTEGDATKEKAKNENN